jgi:hypothetical protein
MLLSSSLLMDFPLIVKGLTEKKNGLGTRIITFLVSESYDALYKYAPKIGLSIICINTSIDRKEQ